MRHIETALRAMEGVGEIEVLEGVNGARTVMSQWFKIENAKEEKGKAPFVTFMMQSDPVKEVGVNGIQATDLIELSKQLIISLNNSFPCKENENTIRALEGAQRHQRDRTKDREDRGVEGEHKA